MRATSKRSPKPAENGAIFYGTAQYPISRAVRAGDFVITSALCSDPIPDYEDQVFTAEGIPLSTGRHRKSSSFADEVHGTFKMVSDALALAGCQLSDVIDCQVWLRDPRDFDELNRIYIQHFTHTRPVRSVFQNCFMADLRVEIKVTAYKPLKRTPGKARHKIVNAGPGQL
jgi:2-iminobutanoate/2-iminopropanoate deaminase